MTSYDLLCSFEDYTLQLDPTANGERLDSSVKDLHWNRATSPFANVNGQQEEFLIEDVLYSVENCMKKHADNLMMHLEGISGRLTQLELYCYKLGRSIGEFHNDIIFDQSEANFKLKTLDKRVHEIHRSVQIIRDKQELSETQEELTKLQLSQKGPTNLSNSQKNNEDLNAATSKNKANYESNDVPNHQLPLAHPYQISLSPPSIVITPDKNHPEKKLPVQQSLPVSLSVLPQDHYVLNQVNAYYYTHHQPLLMEKPCQNLQPELHYTQQRVKMPDLSVQASPKQEQNMPANQPTQKPPFPQFQQHWPEPVQPQQPSQSPEFQTPPAYAPYALNQHANKLPESHQGSSILLPALYSTARQSENFGGSSNTISHVPHQHNMLKQQLPQASQGTSQGYFAPPPLGHCGYVRTSTYPSQSNMSGYNAVYVIDGNIASHLQSCHLGSYQPTGNIAASLISSNYSYGEMIAKAVSVGYPRDQMVGVALGTAENG